MLLNYYNTLGTSHAQNPTADGQTDIALQCVFVSILSILLAYNLES